MLRAASVSRVSLLIAACGGGGGSGGGGGGPAQLGRSVGQ